MKIINTKYIYVIVLLCISFIIDAQQRVLTFTGPFVNPHDDVITARDAIYLQPDFYFTANSTNEVTFKTDPSMLLSNEPVVDPIDPTDRDLDKSLPVGTTAGSFNVSNGTANYTIPIFTPPGTGGMQPSISISYNSQAGFGLLGKGWNIAGISAITRTGSTIYNDNEVEGVEFDTDDKFMLNGQRLIYIGSLGSYQNKMQRLL